MGRAPCCEKIGLKKGRWTSEEDDILMKYIATNGEGSWRSLPQNAGLLRCGKSCRLRWINYLRSDLKRGNISLEEEDTIIKLHASLGNRWSVIAGHLPGRTDNEIKNYWNSHLSRRIQISGPTDSDSRPFDVDIGQVSRKRKGGRLSKSARKKKIQNYGDDDDAGRKGDNVGEERRLRVIQPGDVDAIETAAGGTEESGSASANSSEESSGAHTVKGASKGGSAGVGDEEAQWLDWEMEELRLWDGASGAWAPWTTWDGIETGGVVEDGCNYQLEGSLDNWVSDVLL